jgi:nitroreductase
VDFYDVVTTTRAIRRYTDEAVPDDDLARMLFAATRAPSGSNSQSFRFVVLRRGDAAARPARELLGRGFRSMWGSKRAGDGYDQGSGADRSSPKARMAATMQHFVDHIEEAPVIVLACYRHRHGGRFHEGASVYPACQNLLLTARSLGYGGVMTVWHQAVEDELAELLELPDDVVIAATIPLGRPAGNHGPVRRLPLDELVYDGTWGRGAAWAVEPAGTRHAGPRRTPTE